MQQSKLLYGIPFRLSPPTPPRAENPQLDIYVNTGLVKTTNVNFRANLIALCATCHRCFDLRTPAWVFLPCPLQPFLDAEWNYQAAHRLNPGAARNKDWKGTVFQPYLIREGFINFPPGGIGDARKWHGDPILAILRSYVVLQGLPRLPVEMGGVPQAVAEMYIALIALYSNASENTTILDTITLQPVASPIQATGITEAPPRDDISDSQSVAASRVTGRSASSKVTTTEARAIWSLLMPRGKGKKRLAEVDNVSEIASEASSDQTGHSNDTEQTSRVPDVRRTKRPRIDDEESAGEASRWLARFPKKRSQGKGK